MLTFKASQIISITPVENKPYDFKDDAGQQRSGTTISSTITAVNAAGLVALIKVKGKTEDQVKQKIAKYKIGAAAEIEIVPSLKGGVAQLVA